VFDCAVEIVRRDLFLVHPDVAASVDAILKGLLPPVLRRSAFENPTNGGERARIGDAQISFGEAKPLGRDSPCSEAL
jgi:hypothetical protein